MIVRLPPVLSRLLGAGLALGLALGALGAKPVGPAAFAGAMPDAESAGERLETPQFATLPGPLPGQIEAIGFAASDTSEFGDLVRLAGSAHFVGRVAVTLTSGARHADYPDKSPLGFAHPVTFTLYAVDRSSGRPEAGAVLAQTTETFLMPWRGEAAPFARAFILAFDLAGLGIALPDEVIFSVAFNTRHHGRAPVGQAGPWDLLGLALVRSLPAAGSDVDGDAVFWRTARAGEYADAGAGGIDRFRADAGWASLKPAVLITSSTYGTLFATAQHLESLRGPDPRNASAMSLAASLTALSLDRTLWEGNTQLDPVLGRYVFDLLAEAADELATITAAPGTLPEEARAALETFSVIANSLAHASVADALILSGNAQQIIRAQAAVDRALDLEAEGRLGLAIDELGEAWFQAQLALD